ncbi:MAG: hypothetical protein A2792_00215 [Sphingomonadales bacterium RIFCSPHIGHO2_01_FULL_65_20]|nr:MAG: hypothetical protein A2792_00215 [Sphingomonadales bacterium RIFCSPHIGHO2_01_FULL_65_20]
MSYNLSPFQALEAAVAAAGSQSALGEICGVSQTAVWKWVQSAKRMPPEYVLRAEAATGVSKHDLRPDIYPREIMIDQPTEDRFCGIDMRVGERRTGLDADAQRRVA